MKKKIISIILVLIMCCQPISTVNVEAAKVKCSYSVINKKGPIRASGSNKKYVRIIRTYKELQTLKRRIRKKYANPRKELKQLKKYKKSYFEKNALVFVSIKSKYKEYIRQEVEINRYGKKLNVFIDTHLSDEQWDNGVTNKIYSTYLLNIKKSKIKKVKKVKVSTGTMVHGGFEELPKDDEDIVETTEAIEVATEIPTEIITERQMSN